MDMGNESSAMNRPQKKQGLEVHAVGDQIIVYEVGTDILHYLNPSAAMVLEFCDGNHSPTDIAAVMQEAYGLPCCPLGEVNICLIDLQKTGLIG
jgi:hypothetical protein